MFSEHLQEYALTKFQSRQKYYGPIREEIERGLSGCTAKEAVLMRFLYGTMPVRDAGEYDFDVFYSYVRHAVWLRENVPWCRELPEDIFVHHVLYYRVNSEDISDCREFFYNQIQDRIKGMELEDAVKEINYWCAEHAVYESTDGRTASPMTMYRCGRGRCGEESTFAVTAYRSVGIAARQVYTPRWAHCDDNHAWVEVYIRGKWYFLGACEPEAVLNKGWFSGPASRAILIHSRTFSDFVSEASEEYIGREDLLTYYNNTSSYAKTYGLTIVVRDPFGKPVKEAGVALEILNMAEYFEAASLITDEEGKTHITVGMGDVHIRAWKEDLFAEITVSPKNTSCAKLTLQNCAQKPDWVSDVWEQSRLEAPEEYPMHPGKVTKEQKEANAKRVDKANLLREQRLEKCFHLEAAADFPEEEEILRAAGENFMEIYTFLKGDENPDRKRMLHSLVPKDYKDLKADILEDHLDCQREQWPEDIYIKYLLCPRIYLEELTPYRSLIRKTFTGEEKASFCENPEVIWKYIESSIQYAPQVDYKTICATPVGCLKMKHGSLLSRYILFVAVCRSLGIPARLDKVTLKPEYYSGGRFLVPEGCVEEGAGDCASLGKAVLTLSVEDGGKWSYYQTWTIGRLDEIRFRTLDYEGLGFTENALKLELLPGIYRLLTALRLPNGGQQVSQRVFCLKSGEHKTIEMELGETKTDHMLVSRVLEDFEVQDQAGQSFTLSGLTAEGPAILAFLGVGAEPTEHVLNELLSCAPHWNSFGSRMLMVLRDKAELGNATLRKVLDTVLGISVYFDSGEDSERVAEKMNVDPEKLPVLTVLEEGLKGIYACSGYNVGSVDLMLKILGR